MDFHKLQHTLFEMDPSDPREDLAKLQQAAQSGATDAAPAKNYLEESVEVAEGSMPLGIDSVEDFAALAGVVTEGKKQKPADKVRGSEPTPKKSKPGGNETPHPMRGRLVGEEDNRVAQLEARVEYLEGVINTLLEGKKGKKEMPQIKPRDPNAQYMNDLRSSGAMGAHKDKKKDAKAGKVKHKGQQYESIKNELLNMLRDR